MSVLISWPVVDHESKLRVTTIDRVVFPYICRMQGVTYASTAAITVHRFHNRLLEGNDGGLVQTSESIFVEATSSSVCSTEQLRLMFL